MTETENQNGQKASKKGWRRVSRRLLFAATIVMGFCVSTLAMMRVMRTMQQQHQDPHVVTAWVAGVSYGPNPQLQTGNAFLRWLNQRGIEVFGKAETLTGRFTGASGGVELWLGYRSHLHGVPLLECHRVGSTAFVDDLGQEYHGFLDFEGSCVGVYLPGYDHAAHQLTCALHWMPRLPAVPTPVSRPMVFHIDLPPAHRLLPAAVHLSSESVTQSQDGVTVTAGSVRLDAPKSGMIPGSSQRDLIFHLDVQGGTLACANVSAHLAALTKGLPLSNGGLISGSLTHPLPAAPWNAPHRPQSPMQITDPYGVSLLAPKEQVVPMMSLDATRCTRDRDGVVWIAPVVGAGKGTDAVHIRLYVQPNDRSRSPIPFDFTLPVTADDEM